MPTSSKIMIFFSAILIGAALGSVVGIVIASAAFNVAPENLNEVLTNPAEGQSNILMWINNAAQICTFLLPVALYALMFGTGQIRGLKKFPLMLVLAAPAIVFSASGLIDLTSTINHLLIPEGSWLESKLKPAELAAENMVKILLGEGAQQYLVLAFFSITILPALCEELIFRGVLQPLLSKALSNVHLGIWISAVIFSAIHFQFYGFLPRVLLGAILGYLVLWSGSLWTAIVAHFANNAIAFWMYKQYGTTETPDNSMQSEWYFMLSITLLFGALIYWFYKSSKSDGHHIDYTS